MEQKTNKRPPVKKTYDEENSRFFREALQKSGRRTGKKICTRDSHAAKSDLHEPPICDSHQMSVDPSSNFIDQIARSETIAFPRASSNSKSATRPNSTTASATRPTSTFTTRPTSTSTSTSTTTSATQSLISEGPCLALTEDYEPDLGDFCHVFCRDLVELPASTSTSTSTTAPTSTSTSTSISTSTSTTRPTSTSTNRSSSTSSSTTGSLSASSSSHPTSMSFSSSFTSPIANQGPPIATIPTSNINSEATLSK